MRKSQRLVVPGQSAWIFLGPPVEAGEKPHPLGSGNNSSPEGTDGTDWYKVGVWAFLRRTFMIFIYVLLSNFQVCKSKKSCEGIRTFAMSPAHSFTLHLISQWSLSYSAPRNVQSNRAYHDCDRDEERGLLKTEIKGVASPVFI